MENEYLVLAFYVFTRIKDPKQEVKRFHRFLNSLGAKARIYINEEGINAQMSLSKQNAPIFYDWFLGDPRFYKADIKVHRSSKQAFPKLTVKYRRQLVAMDRKYDISQGGKHLSSEKWAKMIEERDENTLVLDVRNDYEWEVGHFEGTDKPNFETFREFPQYAEALGKTRDPKKTKVMMYCTGGIRCELYSCLLKDQGFNEVFQLDGGIIKYGLEQGNKHWKGKLFVFDDRMVVPITEDERAETISTCKHCGVKVDVYYNCANMDCNHLFLSCLDCVTRMLGCCGHDCTEAPRRRAFEPNPNPKPFRKLPFEVKVKMRPSSE